VEFNQGSLQYNLNNFNLEQKVASINANFEGKVTLRSDVNLIDRDKIIGLDKKQLEAYLSNFPEIAGFEIKFYPFFLMRIPKGIEASKIEIIMQK